jgi:hypothetical protein
MVIRPKSSMATTVDSSPTMNVYATSPRSVNSRGPARIPWTVKAPYMMAADPDPGIPSARSGTMAPPTTALLAHSGAATPS